MKRRAFRGAKGRLPLPAVAMELARRLYDPNWKPSDAELAAAAERVTRERAPMQAALPLSSEVSS